MKKTAVWTAGCLVTTVCALIGIVSVAVGRASMAEATPGPTLPPATILGEWSVTYGNPVDVTIWSSGPGVYTMTADTPVEVSGGSTCDIPPGTTLATFSGSGTSFSGQHNLYQRSNCALGGSTTLNLTLDDDALSGPLGNATTIDLSRIVDPAPSLRSVGLLTFQTYQKDGSGKLAPVIHGCTATVVDSPNLSTIVTAAHCVSGSSAFGGTVKSGPVADLQFAPAHSGECWDNLSSSNPQQVEVSQCGNNPYGVWYANSVDVYTNGHDDFAYVVLAPDATNGRVENIVGGFPMAFDSHDGGVNDPEQTQSWAISGYAADDLDFAKNASYGFGPFECDTGSSSHVIPDAGLLGGVLEACSFVNPITGQEVGFQMPGAGFEKKWTGGPFGSSGGPWTNAMNLGGGATAIGAVEKTANMICGSGGSCDASLGTVLDGDAQTLWASAGEANPPARQTFACSVGGDQVATVSAQTGMARVGQSISLTNVSVTVANPSPFKVKVTAVKLSIPDPNNTSAPYVSGTAAMATTKGWSAGHDATGAFASFSGSFSVGAQDAVQTPALSASYMDLGPVGTDIHWYAGAVSLTISKPVRTTITCTPTSPLTAIASAIE